MTRILLPDEVVFDRFKILQHIGGSGQCWGYKAFDQSVPSSQWWLRHVFLKQYNDLRPGSEEAISLTDHFNAMRNRLSSHDNYICLPMHLGEAANSIIAAYPWIEGATLEDRLKMGLQQDERLRLAIALTKTIRIMHKMNIAHLDLKPANIIVQKGGKDDLLYTRIIDLDSGQIDLKGLRKRVIGTYHYYSPEHRFHERLGAISTRSDIFTHGIMLYELLFRRHPFRALPDYDLAITEEIFDIPENNYHRDVVKVIMQCLSAQPTGRPDAGNILSVLNSHYQNSLEAVCSEDRWESPYYVRLDGQGDAALFRRVYFESILLDRNQLKGTRLGQIPRAPVRIDFNGKDCVLTALDATISVSVDGKRLEEGNIVRLSTGQLLDICGLIFLVNVISRP